MNEQTLLYLLMLVAGFLFGGLCGIAVMTKKVTELRDTLMISAHINCELKQAYWSLEERIQPKCKICKRFIKKGKTFCDKHEPKNTNKEQP